MSFASNITPLIYEHSLVTDQLSITDKKKFIRPKETHREILTLKKHVDLMRRIKNSTERISTKKNTYESLKKSQKKKDKFIREALVFCNLDHIPSNNEIIDWNTSLQCLCYINVLDKIIPLAENFSEEVNKVNRKSASERERYAKNFQSLKEHVAENLN